MSDPLILSARLDLPATSALLASLKERDEGDLILDMSEVKHMGALCMQVMLSAAKTAAATDRSFSVINSSDRVVEQLRVMGMTPESIAEVRQ